MGFSMAKMIVWGVQLRIAALFHRGFILNYVISEILGLLICIC